MPPFLGKSFEDASLDGVVALQNIAAWVVAGTAAYYLWVLPDQRKEEAKRVSEKLSWSHTLIEIRSLLESSI
jgi:hypothetical protein